MSAASQGAAEAALSVSQGSSRLVRLGLSKLVERLGRVERPRWAVRAYLHRWVRKHGIDLDDFEVPEGGYRNFRDFHARPLKAGAREIDRESRVVFPADGFILHHGPIEDGRIGQVKGVDYSLRSLLEVTEPGELDHERYRYFVNLYLPMESCHRWYAPIDGRLCREKAIRGEKFSLDLVSMAQHAGIYAKNERVVQELRNGETSLLLVAVGGIAATNIFRSHAKAPDEEVPVTRGTELGGFFLGSSLILLLPEGCEPVPLVSGETVRMGSPLVR